MKDLGLDGAVYRTDDYKRDQKHRRGGLWVSRGNADRARFQKT